LERQIAPKLKSLFKITKKPLYQEDEEMSEGKPEEDLFGGSDKENQQQV
jgi:hypothetical protein